jgi:hypothetical protein
MHSWMLVIAHPGNEAMFFAPFITALLKTKSAGQAGFLQQKKARQAARDHICAGTPHLHLPPRGLFPLSLPFCRFDCLRRKLSPLTHMSSSGNCHYCCLCSCGCTRSASQ